MAITEAQRNAIDEVISVIISTTPGGRSKRQLSEMFMELVDKEAWPEYYKVIPEARCLTGIKDKLTKNGYKDALNVYADLCLVFLNAMYYNEDGSQISNDAKTLKDILESEWKKRTVLPVPRNSLPPSSPQKKASVTTSTSAISQPQVGSSKQTPPSKAEPSNAVKSKSLAFPPPPPEVPAGASSDMDIDVGGGPSEIDGEGDGDGLGEDMGSNSTTIRDAESDEIVHQLERGLRRWEGFNDKGWTENLNLDRCLEIVQGIKGHKDIVGNSRLATVLDSVPEESSAKDLSYNYPLSLKIIEGNVRSNLYTSSKDFDKDFARLFEKARRWYEPGTDQYGSVLLLQRLYQALTSPSPPSGPPYTSQSNFASVRAGPGTARPLHSANDTDGVPGVTTFRVSTKDRQFVDEVDYKGWSVRLADWLHLANPDDPSRPIVAQVFKCWISGETAKKGQPGVTVCWYYRPEQTFHPANRQFWEGEIFKTGHFADHPLEDIIEKIACQFTARHIRGRPRPPFWYPGWPLYVCDSRYNDRERIFVRIKNWNSCVPEEVRKSTEFMPIYPFERTVFPRRFGSPFLSKQVGNRNVKFPGGIGESIERVDGERIEGGGTGRKRPRKSVGPDLPSSSRSTKRTDEVGPSKGLFVGNNSSVAASGSGANPGSFPYPGYGAPSHQQPIPPRRMEDRSVATAAGGMATLGNNVLLEKLPPETAKHFDRDPDTNEVLWFSGPPNDIAHKRAPQHSLNYLHYLAMKRKKAQSVENSDGSTTNANFDLEPTEKKVKVGPTMTETLNALYLEYFGDVP